jgi:hypothetical protein
MSDRQAARFIDTLNCESQDFSDPALRSTIAHPGQPSGREGSWGYAQIYLPDHPEVSRAEAQDPTFALQWAARMFAANPELWSCYR